MTKIRGVKERIFVWVALDAHTNLILVIRCGSRTRIDAQLFVHELWSRLAPGAPPVFTTWSLPQNEQSLEAQLEWGRAYYHFCRYHESLNYRLPSQAVIVLERQRWWLVSLNGDCASVTCC